MKLPLPNLITRNFWLKFFSIALATVIWLGIHYGIRDQISIDQLNINSMLAQEYVRVPVTALFPPGDTRLFKITPNEVVVMAVGEKMVLRRAAQNSIKAYVDLTKLHSRQSAAEEVHVTVPPDINVLDISPATVAVEQVSR